MSGLHSREMTRLTNDWLRNPATPVRSSKLLRNETQPKRLGKQNKVKNRGRRERVRRTRRRTRRVRNQKAAKSVTVSGLAKVLV